MTQLQQLVHDLSNRVNDLETQLEQERKAKETVQYQYVETFSRLEKADYQLNNYKNWYEEIRKTLERYETENKHLKGLVGLWATN